MPKFFAFHDRDWQSYNARLVRRYKKQKFSTLVGAAQRSHRELVAFLRTVPTDEFERAKALGTGTTITGLLRTEITDEHLHYRQIKAFAKRRGWPRGSEG